MTESPEAVCPMDRPRLLSGLVHSWLCWGHSHFLSLELPFTISQKSGLQIDLQSPAGCGSVNEGLM